MIIYERLSLVSFERRFKTSYVKKIWSYNPNKFGFIPLDKALKRYDDYLSYYRERDAYNFKSFDLWLKTEV